MKNLRGLRGGGSTKKFCDLRGGSMKNKRQYLKGGLQINRGGSMKIF